MLGTVNCIYETPCGWCSKWDKKCERRIGNTGNGCEHQWYQTIYGGGSVNENSSTRTYTIWKCRLCGATKKVEN